MTDPRTLPGGGSGAVVASRFHPRDALDFFPTPAWGTRALIRHVLPELRGARIWEPACGRFHMVRPLQEVATVVASDIVHRGEGQVLDFLAVGGLLVPRLPFGPVDWVVTNPPFKHLLEFVRIGLEVATRGVAILCRLQVLEGDERYAEIFQTYAGRWTVAVFVQRLPMEEGCVAPDKSTATAYCWLIITPGGM